jgi:hypothetical protein
MLRETNAFCTRNMGAHVRCTSSECQRYKKRKEKLNSRAAEKGAKKLVCSDFTKILEWESSNYNKRNIWENIFYSLYSNKSYYLYCFCLSNKRLPNCQHVLSDRVSLHCQRTFSNKRTPNCQQVFSNTWLPNCHSLFSNKRAPNCHHLFSNKRVPNRQRLSRDKRMPNI